METSKGDLEKSLNDNVKKPVNFPLGGLYVPPARMQLFLEQIETDKKNETYQRMAWETLKKSINGLVNKVNVANIAFVSQEIFRENLVRSRGVLCQYLMRAQNASPLFTHVYASLAAVINTKFPRNGELLLRRLIQHFRRTFKRNDKNGCINSAKFIAHLINQNVAHELLALEILTLLLQNPTNDSVEVSISFLKEIGKKLQDVSPKGANAVFERLRNILQDVNFEKRVQYMIEVMFAIRKDGYKDFPTIITELDLVEEDDQITHLLRIDDNGSTEDILNLFKFDPNYEENEEKYNKIKKEILEDSDNSDDESGSIEDQIPDTLEKLADFVDNDSQEENKDDANDPTQPTFQQNILDQTETENINLRRTVYLVIQSSLDFEECAHKLLKLQLKPNQEYEFCAMVIDCCMQQRSYEKFYGLLAHRFCQLKPEYMEIYMRLFKEHYETCHRLDTIKLRNISKLLAYLLYTDAILWTVLEIVTISEEDTTSSSRIFLKQIFQELNELMGLEDLKARLNEETLAPYFQGLFPKNNPKNTRFAINFFTAIGLGGLTQNLREFLKKNSDQAVSSLPIQQKNGPTPLHPLLVQAAKVANASKNAKSDTSSSYSSDESSETTESSSSKYSKRKRSTRRRR